MEAADVVLTGGVVWCGLGLPRAEAVAVKDGRVAATGTTAEIDAMAGPQTRRIDLKGRFAMPGINDSHMHLLPLGVDMSRVDLRPQTTPTLESLLELSAGYQAIAHTTADHREAVRAFVEKRKPRFS